MGECSDTLQRAHEARMVRSEKDIERLEKSNADKINKADIVPWLQKIDRKMDEHTGELSGIKTAVVKLQVAEEIRLKNDEKLDKVVGDVEAVKSDVIRLKEVLPKKSNGKLSSIFTSSNIGWVMAVILLLVTVFGRSGAMKIIEWIFS